MYAEGEGGQGRAEAGKPEVEAGGRGRRIIIQFSLS